MSGFDQAREADRALGALIGGALGDALGMPTQTMTVEEIRAAYGEITDFTAPVPHQPIAANLPAAATTDDTQQSILLANQIIASPDRFDEALWAKTLIAWEEGARARGLQDLLGPSTKMALEKLVAGVPPSETGRRGTTNGAAMRIAPVGIATPPEPLADFIDRIVETCRVTHNTREAIAGAAAVAAVISAGVEGARLDQAFALARAAADEGERQGYRYGKTGMAARIDRALALAAKPDDGTAAGRIAREIGTSVASIESVPAAFALALLAAGDAWRAGLLAANIGDDTDTIGAIAAGMLGACSGAAALPADKVALVMTVNQLEFSEPVASLLAIRRGRHRKAARLERTG